VVESVDRVDLVALAELVDLVELLDLVELADLVALDVPVERVLVEALFGGEPVRRRSWLASARAPCCLG
jgi:hypothetical protein